MKNKDLFPAAWAMYKNSANLDAENDKLDKEQAAEKIEQSYAASFGKAINPVLEPLGFDWKMGLSLVAGLAAKEVVISTLGTVYAVGGDDKNPAPLTDYLQNDPTSHHIDCINNDVVRINLPTLFGNISCYQT